MVIVSGDLTNEGFRQEFEAAGAYVDRIVCPEIIVVPGNHDARNVGYVHFEELLGPRQREWHRDGLSIVAGDSSEPALNHGNSIRRAGGRRGPG